MNLSLYFHFRNYSEEKEKEPYSESREGLQQECSRLVSELVEWFFTISIFTRKHKRHKNTHRSFWHVVKEYF